MKPVNQNNFGSKGNCMSACIASVLELELSNVPNFYEISSTDDEWWIEVRNFLRKYGWGLLSIGVDENMIKKYEGVFIVGGTSPRFHAMQHAVIWQNGKMIHDPHPDNLGVINIESIDMLYPINPARFQYDN